MTDTGQIVKMLRKSMGWTVPQLAEKAGISANTVANVERGSNCTILVFDSLVEAMGYEIEILPVNEDSSEEEESE